MSHPKLLLTRVLPATKDKVFEAWTQPAMMQRWFSPGAMTTPTAIADLRVGGAYKIVMRSPEGEEHTVSGVYREIVPDEKLVFTWRWEGQSQHESVVTILFKNKGSETELTLIHEQLESEESKAKHNHGWLGCLEKLHHLSIQSQRHAGAAVAT